jgi:hypothetical protein
MAKRILLENKLISVVEFTPQSRTIKLNISNARGLLKRNFEGTLYLSFPYMQFAQYQHPVHGPILFTSCTPKPLINLNDPVGLPMLPNVNRDLSVYMGNLIHPNIDQSIENFFTSIFTDNDYYFWPGVENLGNLLGDYQTWAENSKLDPNFIMKLPFSSPCKPIVGREEEELDRRMRYTDIPSMSNFLSFDGGEIFEEAPLFGDGWNEDDWEEFYKNKSKAIKESPRALDLYGDFEVIPEPPKPKIEMKFEKVPNLLNKNDRMTKLFNEFLNVLNKK